MIEKNVDGPVSGEIIRELILDREKVLLTEYKNRIGHDLLRGEIFHIAKSHRTLRFNYDKRVLCDLDGVGVNIDSCPFGFIWENDAVFSSENAIFPLPV